MISWLRRLLHVPVHQYELVLPLGQREYCWLYVRDSIMITVEGEVEPVVVVERLGSEHTRITFRSDDERLTVGDLELLREQPPVPA